MKILMIEDNLMFVEAFVKSLEAGHPTIQVVNVTNRQDAESALTDSLYDLVILDMKLPNTAVSFDDQHEVGEALFHFITKNSPGVPIRILSSSETSEFLQDLAAHGAPKAPWGIDQIPMVTYCTKPRVDKLISEILLLAPLVDLVNSIRIDKGGRQIDLKAEEERALRIFVNSRGGKSAAIKRLGGLSGSWVLKVAVKDEKGTVIHDCVAKIGKHKIRGEMIAYNQYVTALGVGKFAHVLHIVDAGIGNYHAIFYQLADEVQSLFDYTGKSQKSIDVILKSAKALFQNWHRGAVEVTASIGDVRRALIEDEVYFEALAKTGFVLTKDIESVQISIRRCVIHGDLHGGNLLLDPDLNPILIDYGEVGIGYTCLDPITLELSCIFHPDQAGKKEFPNLHLWPQLDQYCENHPDKGFVEGCREWAHELGGSDLAVLACAYGYVARQLKYSDTNMERIQTLMTAITQEIRKLNPSQ
jgi:CheY-like chemotaxis protein